MGDDTAPPEHRYVFFDRVEIGRDDDERPALPGLLLVRDAMVSWSHCFITQSADGRCYVRDLSRNGTRVDGRRLVPNAEEEIRVGQTLMISAETKFLLVREPAADPVAAPEAAAESTNTRRRTQVASTSSAVTVLVGDIRDFTVLVRTVPSARLQRSVNRVFETLTTAVVEHGGTVKEFQGDALVAFWEGNARGGHAVAACRAVLALNVLSQRIAADRDAWALRDFPLVMDWALASGSVVIDAFGVGGPMGLSVVGKPVVLAFRLEKLIGDDTGPIVTCRETRRQAGHAFTFRDLGERRMKGFDKPDRVFALVAANA